ncbi:transposase [Paeniglutamicibacter sp. Y32M11]|uniref:transposase n=1 Tax=Paeniglutamicibacter sp. Y32M11 TaxID=2853258 RepID=UPI001C531C04|nr:transposase [Paeniglutamicibacter sp. Y32M11]
MERVNKKIKRRNNGRHLREPNGPAAPGGPALVEQHDEWKAGDRRYLSECSMTELMTLDQQVNGTVGKWVSCFPNT